MSFVVGAAALFSGAGAVIGWFVAAILVRVLSPRALMWGLRLLGAVSLLPLLGNVDYARSRRLLSWAGTRPWVHLWRSASSSSSLA